ncbi:MAG: hypothetical protein ACTTID_04085 [Bacillales bacterium]
MPEIILNLIDKKEDLLFLSKSFKEGKIRMKISKYQKIKNRQKNSKKVLKWKSTKENEK